MDGGGEAPLIARSLSIENEACQEAWTLVLPEEEVVHVHLRVSRDLGHVASRQASHSISPEKTRPFRPQSSIALQLELSCSHNHTFTTHEESNRSVWHYDEGLCDMSLKRMGMGGSTFT